MGGSEGRAPQLHPQPLSASDPPPVAPSCTARTCPAAGPRDRRPSSSGEQACRARTARRGCRRCSNTKRTTANESACPWGDSLLLALSCSSPRPPPTRSCRSSPARCTSVRQAAWSRRTKTESTLGYQPGEPVPLCRTAQKRIGARRGAHRRVAREAAVAIADCSRLQVQVVNLRPRRRRGRGHGPAARTAVRGVGRPAARPLVPLVPELPGRCRCDPAAGGAAAARSELPATLPLLGPAVATPLDSCAGCSRPDPELVPDGAGTPCCVGRRARHPRRCSTPTDWRGSRFPGWGRRQSPRLHAGRRAVRPRPRSPRPHGQSIATSISRGQPHRSAPVIG